MLNKGRLRKVIENMEKEALEQIIVTSTSSLYYLTGLWIEPHERMIALYISVDGEAVLFGNEIFGIEKQDGLLYTSHRDGDNPVEAVADIMKPGKIGIDKFWSSKFLIGLMELRKDIIPVVGSYPVDYARMFKDEYEKEKMIQASRINDEVMQGAISAVKEGVRENELASLVNRLFLERGADCEGVQLVCFGANAADPHHAADSTKIQKGDCVIFDIFTPIQRYWCDMTRTVFFGDVQEEARKIYELVRRANETAEKMIRPGLKLSDFDKAAREVIANGGYGKYFTHRLGHNIGIDCHEVPDVSGVSDMEAKPGMVFSVEPGIYLPGRFGVRIEDLVLVTEDGCRVLNNASKDFRIIN